MSYWEFKYLLWLLWHVWTLVLQVKAFINLFIFLFDVVNMFLHHLWLYIIDLILCKADRRLTFWRALIIFYWGLELLWRWRGDVFLLYLWNFYFREFWRLLAKNHVVYDVNRVFYHTTCGLGCFWLFIYNYWGCLKHVKLHFLRRLLNFAHT